MSNHYASMSDDACAEVAKEALAAARVALGSFTEDQTTEISVRLILSAFVAIEEVKAIARDEFQKTLPAGVKADTPYIDEHHIVATAIWAQQNEIEVPGVPIEPYSVAGAKITAYSMACNCLERLSDLEATMGMEQYGLGSGAAQALERMRKQSDEGSG